MKKRILKKFQSIQENRQKGLAILLDPEKVKKVSEIGDLLSACQYHRIDFIFFGGSTITSRNYAGLIFDIKEQCDIPLVLFPGNYKQLHRAFDAVLFLSLISGRNPEYLIGQHVLAARELRDSEIETIPTSYILVGDDKNTSVAYVSNTTPIPSGEAGIVVNTAIAGELLGHRCTYLDAGSGAKSIVPPNVVSEVKKNVSTPLIVGGGITQPKKSRELYISGADIVVIGNLLEKEPGMLSEFVGVRDAINKNSVRTDQSKVH